MTTSLQENTAEQTKAEKRRKIFISIFIVLIVILLILLAIEIAYIADFYIYRNSGQDGRLWTEYQRIHGLFSSK
ncbi:hypothetical protein [Mycoplasmopsis gallopavonis]|uniref:Uncharacterized protein n=1 Tax=Mycoplasmopsis gallopavonis TaxID=76629 RepID=A0A449B0G4_9BACT|nr:hypothetical protein [Mycoplasmopsis gallopavonis]RIV17023.1 hypothetical protein D1113_00165 [Mycoplasmopsis gallopavonis]VEU73272.1 Uncharacterised protein [Mycoplasmopsis gallopavonis]